MNKILKFKKIASIGFLVAFIAVFYRLDRQKQVFSIYLR